MSNFTDKILDFLPIDPVAHFFDDAGRMDTNPTRLAGIQACPDEAAVFSVLQAAAVIPPLSPWRGVKQFMPGYRYRGTTCIGPLSLEVSPRLAALNEEQQLEEVNRLLDEILLKLIGECGNPVVLFSGGVDSGIIASRLKLLGRHDTLLLNYSFGPDDSESQLAEAMAKRLGLRFERISGSSAPFDCLDRPGQVFQQPFADISTGPTAELALAVIDRLAGEKRPILNGLAADGIFGLASLIRAWQRVRQVPRGLRRGASAIYGAGLWRQTGKLEHYCRIARRSAIMPPVLDALSLTPLAGVLYRDEHKEEVHRLFETWMHGFSGDSVSRQWILMDMALLCGAVSAAKEYSIFARAGLQIHYPFMQMEMLPLAIAAIDYWKMYEPKRVLKQSLARHVPSDMVYRRKSGFVDPRNRLFYDQQFIAYLRAAAEPSAPIAFVLRESEFLKACDLLSRGSNLPTQTFYCLWAIVFMDRWYRTAVDASDALPQPI